MRSRVRRELGLSSGQLVISHVARFGPEKNHRLSVSILSELLKDGHRAVLLLIGEGPLIGDIQNLVKAERLDPHVKFLGQRKDVSDLLQAADVAVLPSFFEGVPYSLLEAQAAGLHAVASDRVDRLTDACGRISFVPLDSPTAVWAAAVVRSASEPRIPGAQPLLNTKFDAGKSREVLLEALFPTSSNEQPTGVLR